ncbi:hypothetical protein [Streptomyces justiciae]|uniref:hypothetical protein n=1 Tax=Streptomyces justiciae TaxID=2780140 RepID=UPI002117C0AC|nr:hypothetical protein [Streptomyces justiciae]MCW8383966.1 hypothetical protein [Streptomyces justiciae]
MSTDEQLVSRDVIGSPRTTPARLEELRNRLGRQGSPRICLAADGTVKRALVIPTDLGNWHPTEITRWLSGLEDDVTVSDTEIHRAREAVGRALSVD